MKTGLISLSALLLLSACGMLPNDAAQKTGPDGRPAYHAVCTGLFNSMANCVRAAEKKCPGGYEIVAGGPEAAAAEAAARAATPKTKFAMEPVDRSMTFTCK